jgi:autotransporter-associated beta strand protein
VKTHLHATKSLLEELASRSRLRGPTISLAAIILIFFTGGPAFAGTGIWLSSPVDADWNNPLNWSPMIVPNGPSDTATFDSSLVPNVSISTNTEVNGIVFNPLARLTPFTITAKATLTISGVGITNNSGAIQNFVAGIGSVGAPTLGAIAFRNNATAGSMIVFTNNDAPLNDFARRGFTEFNDTSNAGSATFNNLGGFTVFNDTSSAAGAVINNKTGANGASRTMTFFNDSSTAGNATITNIGSIEIGHLGSSTEFSDTSSAGSATITANGLTFPSVTEFDEPGFIIFQDNSTGGNATLIANGGSNGGSGGSINFGDHSSGGSATLIANGGSNGGRGGTIIFRDHSSGGTARVEVLGNASLVISLAFNGFNFPAITIGSIEGTGHVFLGAGSVAVGSNPLSVTFSGVMEAGVVNETIRGSFTKIGTGTFTLSGANTIAGDTNINSGVLRVDGSIASANTFVNRGGSLSGTGTVGGNVSNGGIVAPGDSPGTLHVTGNYSQSNGGVLDIEIASLFSFDQLMVSGTATLGGTLDVSLDGYTGHAGDIFTILTSSSLSGNFATIDLPTLGNGLFFTERVTSNDVLLTVNGPTTGVPDQGSTLLLMASALAALFGIQRIRAGAA